GMGEPLDNYENLIKAIHVINSREGMGIGARKITISTCGIVPGILKLKGLGLQVELSVSLHAANDALRDELVPVNRKYPLNALTSACIEYYENTGRVITLEYILLKGKNDSGKDANQLIKIAKRIKARVNLIVYNAGVKGKYERSDAATIDFFESRLRAGRINVTRRRSRGEDISAACGQLAAGGLSEKKRVQTARKKFPEKREI
ncbi:MAG: hypothetical protein ABH883_08960, partial [Candidatus Omnitrophota bacterium]